MLVRLRKLVRGTEGTIMVMTAFGLVAFLGLASLAIDMGQLYVARNELQNVADGAALAAARQLIDGSSGTAVVNSTKAHDAAMLVAQEQAKQSGQTVLPDGSRNDVSVAFGNWNVYSSNPGAAWTDTDGSSSSNSNAVRVTIQRANGLAYGPVTSLFAGVLGFNNTNVSATATAYLGFASGTSPGGVNLPLAIPDTAITAANPAPKSWWASLLGPTEAVAGSATTLKFWDLSSNNGTTFNDGTSYQQPKFNLQKGYMVIVNNGDPVPDTINNNLIKQYNSLSGTPVRKMNRGDQLYALSEYQWASNNKTIFNNFYQAWNAKKDSVTKNWRVVVPVYSSTKPLASRLEQGWKMLAGLFSFGPSPAYACWKFLDHTGYNGAPVPIYVEGFAGVDVTNVTYNASCDDCSSYNPAKDGKNYVSQLDCLMKSAGSCNNQNSVTVVVPAGSTMANPGSTTGGADNAHINPGGGSPGVGTYANTDVRLVQ